MRAPIIYYRKSEMPKKEDGVIYMYTVPKTFSVENKYKQFRL